MDESSLIDKFRKKLYLIFGSIMVTYFIKNGRTLNSEKPKSCQPNYIVDNIINIRISTNDILDKLMWSFFYGKFSVKTVT